MADARKYSDQEVRAIIDRALERDADAGADISHADLLAIGEQIGVAPEAMARAAEEARAARAAAASGQAIASRRRRWLAAHALVFAVLNGLLYAVNAATTPGEWWVLFPVFFWGLALLLHAGLTFGLAPSKRALERERLRLAPPTSAQNPRLRVEQDQAAAEAAEETPEAWQEPAAEQRKL